MPVVIDRHRYMPAQGGLGSQNVASYTVGCQSQDLSLCGICHFFDDVIWRGEQGSRCAVPRDWAPETM